VHIVFPAEILDVAVELSLGEQSVELVVEGVPGGARQLGARHPEVRLVIRLPTAHTHGRTCDSCPAGMSQTTMPVKHFFNRLLSLPPSINPLTLPPGVQPRDRPFFSSSARRGVRPR